MRTLRKNKCPNCNKLSRMEILRGGYYVCSHCEALSKITHTKIKLLSGVTVVVFLSLLSLLAFYPGAYIYIIIISIIAPLVIGIWGMPRLLELDKDNVNYWLKPENLKKMFPDKSAKND